MSSVGQIGVVVTTAPTAEPVSLAEAKLHLRVTHNEDDADITRQIVTARVHLEKVTGRALMLQTIRASYEDFPRIDSDVSLARGYPPVIELPRSPATGAADLAVKYLDTDEAEQTLDAATYLVDTDALPTRVRMKYGGHWPDIPRRPGCVRVEYKAGAATAAAVEEDAKHLIKLLVGQLYAQREMEVTGTIVTQVRGYRELLAGIKIPFPQ